MNLKNDLLLRAARGEKTERTPVWLMRQAGRILPEYREVRKSVKDFKALVENPELAAEVTIQPVDILDVDAAIIFSDILVIPEAMGLTYEMIEAKGPFFPKTINNQADIEALKIVDGASDLKYVCDALRITKSRLIGRVPLIGFAGAPWTILAYMVEGSGSKTFSRAKKFLYTQPGLAHMLLEKITLSTISYLKAQVAAGADLVQIFDSWASSLSPEQYAEFGSPYINRISSELSPLVPVTVFAKGAFYALQDFNNSTCDVIGLDWTTSPAMGRELAPDKTLQGNMDPCLLYADYDTIRREVKKMTEAFGTQRYIANLGHGLYPDTDPEKVKCFIESLKEYSLQKQAV